MKGRDENRGEKKSKNGMRKRTTSMGDEEDSESLFYAAIYRVTT